MANSVEKYTTYYLDPLRYDEIKREEFGDGLEEILDHAIQLDQKKVLYCTGRNNKKSKINLTNHFIQCTYAKTVYIERVAKLDCPLQATERLNNGKIFSASL